MYAYRKRSLHVSYIAVSIILIDMGLGIDNYCNHLWAATSKVGNQQLLVHFLLTTTEAQ